VEEGVSGANPSLEGLGSASTAGKLALYQCLTSQFCTHPNREFFAALQRIKSGDQGNIRPDQGKRPLARVLPGVGGEARCAIALTRQPRSPKRLGHRVATGGHGIASAGTRLGTSETFLRSVGGFRRVLWSASLPGA
jgi:hypothetical protein